MTPREFRQLHAIPFDIKARTRRIQQLEAKQAEGPELVADVVKSSCGDGNAVSSAMPLCVGQLTAYTPGGRVR